MLGDRSLHEKLKNTDLPVRKQNKLVALDAVEAVARIAYKTNEVCIIYPITPASAICEYADEWAT